MWSSLSDLLLAVCGGVHESSSHQRLGITACLLDIVDQLTQADHLYIDC
jgi:hypothetical protein